jgi:RNA polymerase sigma-70 factor (ECF subfamily)
MEPAPNHADSPHLTDQQLVRNYQLGQEHAFVLLMERYRNELYHFLFRFLGNRSSADDIFQEAFLQVHLSIDSFDTTRPFKPWLFTVAANKARDYLRKNKKHAAELSASVTDNQPDGTPLLDLIDTDLEVPQDAVELQETRRLVQDTIASLPVHLREILIMAYFHQLPYKEIASNLGIPLGTVKSRLHAAVASFAQAWKKNQKQ